ncbi:MAG: hypothetical protein IJ584_03080 [Bacteroidales bacterium]|nr:hypothetical protein [Bacteroidales bacterium]
MALTGKPGLGKKRKIQHFFTNINPNEGTLDVTGGKNLSAETEKVSSTVQVSIQENVELYFNWKETYIEISGGSSHTFEYETNIPESEQTYWLSNSALGTIDDPIFDPITGEGEVSVTFIQRVPFGQTITLGGGKQNAVADYVSIKFLGGDVPPPTPDYNLNLTWQILAAGDSQSPSGAGYPCLYFETVGNNTFNGSITLYYNIELYYNNSFSGVYQPVPPELDIVLQNYYEGSQYGANDYVFKFGTVGSVYVTFVNGKGYATMTWDATTIGNSTPNYNNYKIVVDFDGIVPGGTTPSEYTVSSVTPDEDATPTEYVYHQ